MNVRVWVGCLAHYNNGDLIGEWVDATDAGDWVCPKRNPDDIYINCEEYWVMDHEIPGVNGEMDPVTAVKWGELFADVDDDKADGFTAWVKWRGFTSPGEIDPAHFEDEYRGAWDSEKDYAMETAGELLHDQALALAKSLDTGRYSPGHGLTELIEELIRYFDWDQYARELFMQGHHFEDGHVFSD
jgi:antirestriction protein